MSYRDDSARPEEDDEDDDLSLPTVDGLTDTAATTAGLPTRLTELLAQRPGAAWATRHAPSLLSKTPFVGNQATRCDRVWSQPAP